MRGFDVIHVPKCRCVAGPSLYPQSGGNNTPVWLAKSHSPQRPPSMDHQFSMMEWQSLGHQAACRVAHSAMPQQPPLLPTVIQPPFPLPAEVWQRCRRDYEARLDLFRIQHYLKLQTAWQQRAYHPQAIGFSRQPLPGRAPVQHCAPAVCITAPLQQEPPAAPAAAPAVLPMALPTTALVATPQTEEAPSSRSFQFRDDSTLLISILESALKTGTLRERFIKERDTFSTKTFHGRTMLSILRKPALFAAISANKDMLSPRELAVFTDFIARKKKIRSDLL